MVLVHTLRTAVYIVEGMGHWFRLVASNSDAAQAIDARPCHPNYLPPFVFTDHDLAIINGLTLLFNPCVASVYRSLFCMLLQACADSISCLLLLGPHVSTGEALVAARDPVGLGYTQVAECVTGAAQLEGQQQQHWPANLGQQQLLPFDLAGVVSCDELQQLDIGTPAAGLCQVAARLAAALPVWPTTGFMSEQAHATSVYDTEPEDADAAAVPAEQWATVSSAMSAYAVAAEQILELIKSLVYLRVCAWHWIKACKDYAHIGAPFRQLPLPDRKYISWLLGILLGRPAVQTRFRGLHQVTTGILYLKAVAKVCRTKHLLADPDGPVEQLGGLVVVHPATAADVKAGSCRGKPSYVAEYPYFLTASMMPVRVRVYSDNVFEGVPDPADSPSSGGAEQQPADSSNIVSFSSVSKPSDSSDSGNSDCSRDVTSSSSNSSCSNNRGHIGCDSQQQSRQCHVRNPLAFDGIASYAETILATDTHVLAFPCADDLHLHLSGPFVQSDGLKPKWAVTNRTTGRAEAGIKDTKHTQGGSSGPVQLTTFVQHELVTDKGACERWFQELRRQPALNQSKRRQQGTAKRESAWFDSDSSTLTVVPGQALGSDAAVAAGLLPAAAALKALIATTGSEGEAAFHADVPPHDWEAAEPPPGHFSPSSDLDNLAAAASADRPPLGAMTGVCDGDVYSPDDVPTTSSFGFHAGLHGPVLLKATGRVSKDEETCWGAPNPGKRSLRLSTMASPSETLLSELDEVVPFLQRGNSESGGGLAAGHPRRAAAIEAVRRAAMWQLGGDAVAQEEALPRQGRTNNHRAGLTGSTSSWRPAESHQVLLTSGRYGEVSVGDDVVVRTTDKNNLTFGVPAKGLKWRVYMLKVTGLEVLGQGGRLRAYGRFYNNTQGNLECTLQLAEEPDDDSLQLQNTTVVVWSQAAPKGQDEHDVITALSFEQMSDITAGVRVVLGA